MMTKTNLSERQKLILGLVVQEFVERAKPVGSTHLVQHYGLEISPATVRNELAALAELGFLRQPHTSAGREPTEKGYRFFVGGLMQRSELPSTTKHTINHQFYQARHEVDQWMRLAASILATQSQAASLVTPPQVSQATFKHLELIHTSGRQILMVVVLENGQVIQQMLALREVQNQEQLSQAANDLNQAFSGKSSATLESDHPKLSLLAQDILILLSKEVAQADQRLLGDIFHDGWNHVLAEPEFSESNDAQRALRVLEERPLLEDLLSQTMGQSEIGGVQVLIGGEGRWEELNNFSLVLARYGAPDAATGYLGVLGPIRMAYSRAVTAVDYVANIMSNIVIENLSEMD
jgi:heat-inducible transcriptional repressor